MKKKQQEEIQDIPGYNPEDSPPTKLEEFPVYNKWARKNKLPVMVPDESYYPKVKVRFQRFDQPENVLKARVRTKDIDWQGQLIPGGIYELAMPVIKWLNSLAEPVFAEVKLNDPNRPGERSETKQIAEKARFSCQPVEFIGAAA